MGLLIPRKPRAVRLRGWCEAGDRSADTSRVAKKRDVAPVARGVSEEDVFALNLDDEPPSGKAVVIVGRHGHEAPGSQGALAKLAVLHEVNFNRLGVSLRLHGVTVKDGSCGVKLVVSISQMSLTRSGWILRVSHGASASLKAPKKQAADLTMLGRARLRLILARRFDAGLMLLTPARPQAARLWGCSSDSG